MKLLLGIASIALSVSGAAHAGKYECRFQEDKNPPYPCTIVSGGANSTCSHPFSAKLTGGCLTITSSKEDLLGCAIFTGSAPDLSAMKQDNTPELFSALAQLPGFVVAAVTLGPQDQASISVGYVEKQGSPELKARCERQPP
jgi:hypothetical protein